MNYNSTYQKNFLLDFFCNYLFLNQLSICLQCEELTLQISMKEAHYQRLISAIKTGNEKGISELYDLYSDALYGLIYRIIPDEGLASDCLQEVFMKIWENGKSYDSEKGRLFTWMSRIARNTALNAIESKGYKNQKRIQTDEKIVSISEKHSSTDRSEWMDLKGIVNELPQKYQEMIYYCYFKGFTQKEVSDELEIPLGTVKTRMKNALKKLRTIYNYEVKNIAILVMVFWLCC